MEIEDGAGSGVVVVVVVVYSCSLFFPAELLSMVPRIPPDRAERLCGDQALRLCDDDDDEDG